MSMLVRRQQERWFSMEQLPAQTYIRVCRQRQEPDQAHAPLSFKLYRDCRRIPLSQTTLAALATGADTQSACPPGVFLHEIYGIVRMSAQRVLSHTDVPGDSPAETGLPSPWPGRPVASGG